MVTAWQFFAKWVALLFLVMMLARTQLGYRAVYYGLWLMVVFVLVTHSQDVANVFNPQPPAAATTKK